MEEFKEINSMNEVREALKNFQELYTNKDTNQIEGFVKKTFSLREGLTVLGSGMNQWCFNADDITALIQSHMSAENNYWKEVDFKFEEAKVFANKDVAWVVSIGNIKNTIPEHKQIEETMNLVTDILGREKKSKENTLDAVRKIANTLLEIDKGESYVWPFRFTCVLINENGTWKFHQMQFSLDSESWAYRFVDENYDKSVFEMSKTNSNEEVNEIRKVLQIFQDGYTKRDIGYVDEYMKEVFLPDEDLVVIGTDAEELCLGIDATRGIVESDWKYWGNFKLNAEDAIICVNGDVAYFTTKAMLDRRISNDTILLWISESAKYTLRSEEAPKHKLMKVLHDTLDFLYENEKGETFITPMRFSGVLVKKEGRWLIQHVQYSDYADGKPGVRITA
jgi:ketosteroid isomerase-like protein